MTRAGSRRRFEGLRASVDEQEIAVSWTMALVLLPLAVVAALGSYSGGVLAWLNAQFSLGWFCVFALAVMAFAGAYVATEPPLPPATREHGPPLIRRLGGTRVLALTLFCVSVYLLTVLGNFVHDRAAGVREGRVTWWGIPFSLCFWSLAAVQIASETERSGSGEPADRQRQWQWFVAARSSRTMRWLSYAFLLSGTVAGTVLGSWPNLAWGTAPHVFPAWRGRGYEPNGPLFVGFVIWGAILVVTAFLFLAHSYRARPSGLPDAVLRRAWYSQWAAGALVVLVILLGLAGLGWLSEPLVDVALSLYVLRFVLLVIEASASTRFSRFRSSMRRRTVAACAAIGFAFGTAVILGLHPFRAGLLAAALAGALPLAPSMFRGLFGIEREPAKPPPPVKGLEAPLLTQDERDALYSLLIGEPSPGALPAASVLGLWKECLEGLAKVPLPEGKQNIPSHHVLEFILFTCDDGLSSTPPPTMTAEISDHLQLLFPSAGDKRKHALLALMRRTARRLMDTNEDKSYAQPPGAMEMLLAECIARLPGARASQNERTKRILDCRREWLYGNLETWTGDSEPVFASGRHVFNNRHNGLRTRRLAHSCPVVLRTWLNDLEQALTAMPGNEPPAQR